MQEETRHQIALCRYKLISPVLAEPSRMQNAYFRVTANKHHVFPHYGPRKVTVPTLKRWLKLYRQHGFDALKPKPRIDNGRTRRLTDQAHAAVVGKCKAFPNWTIQKLYEDLLADSQLGDPPICYNSLRRIIRAENLLPPQGRTDVRKRYEYEVPNELWVCDFMHGPHVRVGKRHQKAILCAIIDDHSRMIVGHAFSIHETVASLTRVFKNAILAFGVPKRFYVDNGAAFNADLLASACAKSGIALIHSKPYDPPSRGKIERYFRTVRDRFLPDNNDPEITLATLNQNFALWLQNDYHHRIHKGIDQKPIDRYNAGISKTHVSRLTAPELDQIFLVQHERIVGNDATISFKGNIYEVPAAYVRQRVDIRHPVDEPEEIYLFDNGARIAKLKFVNKKENARTFRPQKVAARISYAKGKVQR